MCATISGCKFLDSTGLPKIESLHCQQNDELLANLRAEAEFHRELLSCQFLLAWPSDALTMSLMFHERRNLQVTQLEKFARCLDGAIAALCLGQYWGADLKPEMLRRWEEYIQMVDARNQARLAPGATFLSSDEIPEQMAKLRSGEIVVTPVGPLVPMKVP